ncbi:MAG: hypothetical protein CMQ51_03345 [Gammaproteobacteria bacterium]|nr:hypothetical protein [Gammaproteobacteria bacterium]
MIKVQEMKNLIKFLILISHLFAVEKNWNSHSAHILEKGRWEVGLFQPFRYGYTKFAEFSVHPGWFFIIPNIQIKESQADLLGFKTASKYKIFYPTPLLNSLSKLGAGGVIAPEHKMPLMFSLSGTYIGSKIINGIELTLKGGLDIGVVLGDLNSLSTIDLPLVYHRLGVYYNGWGVHSGFDVQKYFYKKFNFIFDLDLVLLPGYEGVYSFENKFLLSWNKSDKFKIMTGYKLVLGEYPYGKDFRILPYFPIIESWIPIIEFQWAGKRK